MENSHTHSIDLEDCLSGRKPSEWRKQEGRDVSRYVLRQNLLINQRIEKGRAQYGTGNPQSLFQNNPMKHLKEEIGDLLFYADWTERELEAKIRMLSRAHYLLAVLFRQLGGKEQSPVYNAHEIKDSLYNDVKAFLEAMLDLQMNDDAACR